MREAENLSLNFENKNKKSKGEAVFEKIMAKNIPDLMKDMNK